LEKDDTPGGRTKTITRDGFTFDLGPTFFHYPQIIAEIFQAIGRDAYEELGLTQLDPNYRLVFGLGGSIDATNDLDRMAEQIRELAGDADAEGFQDYIMDNRRKLKLANACMQSPWKSPLDLLSKRAFRVLRVLRPTRSVASDLARHFKDERTRLAMSFQTKYLGMNPFQAPSLFTILSYLEYEHGIFHAKGGLGSITKRMAEIAVEMGVELRLGEPAEELLMEGKTVIGARTAGGEVRAACVIVNADFAHAMTTLVDDQLRHRWTKEKLASKSYSCSTFMLYLSMDRVYDTPHHQIYASTDYGKNLDDVVKGKVTWDDPSIYVQNACVTDPSLAPDGCSTLYVLVPVPHTRADLEWNEISPDYRDVILSQMEKLGFEDLEKHIKSEMILTPDDWANSSIYRGAVFNLSHSLNQMLWKRPQNRLKDFNQVYVVGGGTHPGSGLPTIFESARISSKLVCADLGIKPDWNGQDTWFPDVRYPKVRRKRSVSQGSPSRESQSV